MQEQINLLCKRMAGLESEIRILKQSPPSLEKENAGGSKDAWLISKKMEALERVAQGIKDRFSSEVAFGVQWDSPEKKKEYLGVKRQIKQLNGQLASL